MAQASTTPATFGQRLAARQLLNQHFNLDPEECVTAKMLSAVRDHLEIVKTALSIRIMNGAEAGVAIEGGEALTYTELRIANWPSDQMSEAVPFYPIWKEVLLDWAESQNLVLEFKDERATRSSPALFYIRAKPTIAYAPGDIPLEELLADLDKNPR